MFKKLTKIENLVIALVVISAVATAVYQSNPRDYTIRPNADWKTITVDDQTNGGNSSAIDESTDSEFAYRYHIRNGAANAFAILMLRPTEEDTLFDWRWMESISITAYIEGKESDNYRLILRNREEKSFMAGDSLSQKFNLACLKLTNRPTTQTITSDKFYVPSWWTELMSIPPEDSTPRFDSIEWIEFNTASVAEQGECRVVIEEIKISGRWISASLFYKSMFGMWLCFGSLVACSQIVGLRKKLAESETMELSLQRQTAKLARIATLDPLTQLFNRRGMRPHATLAMRELRKTGKSFGLIMFDIDNFKNLNDQNGHSYGDKVLRHVALVVAESLKEDEPASRWGGEEFVIICRDGNLQRATALAERIRQRIENDIQITCSFGVCEVGPGSEFSEALDLVDECLYQAKQDGKNCVKTATCVGPNNHKTPVFINAAANIPLSTFDSVGGQS